jgi:hypothetical protein
MSEFHSTNNKVNIFNASGEVIFSWLRPDSKSVDEMDVIVELLSRLAVQQRDVVLTPPAEGGEG